MCRLDVNKRVFLLIPRSQRLSFILSWQILRRDPLILYFFWHEALRAEKRKSLVKTVVILTFMPSGFDRHFWLEDIFNCSTSHLIGWIKYLWGCDWSTENDIFDSCQVVDQRESEILNDLDQWLSFLSAWCFDQCFFKEYHIKRKPLGPGYSFEELSADSYPWRFDALKTDIC